MPVRISAMDNPAPNHMRLLSKIEVRFSVILVLSLHCKGVIHRTAACAQVQHRCQCSGDILLSLVDRACQIIALGKVCGNGAGKSASCAMMPKLDGVQATMRIREEKNIPIIMLSAKSEDYDKIIGLNVGADDYVTKPFNPLELIARVKSNLRRYMDLGSMEIKSGVYKTGGLVVDDDEKTVTVDGEQVSVTPTEFGILKLLVKNAGRVFSMVLSHHYEPEYGSPKKPLFPEAEVLHYLDILDARMFDMYDALSSTEPGDFSDRVWTLDNRRLYKPTESGEE